MPDFLMKINENNSFSRMYLLGSRQGKDGDTSLLREWAIGMLQEMSQHLLFLLGKKLILDMVELEKPKQEYTEEELLRLSMNKINSNTSNIVIYTDGSTDGSQENGGAGVYIEDEQGNTLLQTSFAAGKYCSSYSGECVAMLRTVEWLLEHPQTSTICTDSLSLHSALASNDWKDKDPWLKQIKMKMFHGSTGSIPLRYSRERQGG